jgi:hypothetical protein
MYILIFKRLMWFFSFYKKKIKIYLLYYELKKQKNLIHHQIYKIKKEMMYTF